MLYVVATPIGNLKDITLRALETLKEADFILCEDTRVTRKLLAHYQIKTLTISYHQHTPESKIRRIIELLSQGKKLALVTDAGTPGISDPGNKLISALCRDRFQTCPYQIIPIPGPSALTAALSICGFPADKFFFAGFPPHKKRRRQYFQELSKKEETIVFYESTHRIIKTLTELVDFVADRPIMVAREITKQFETVYRGNMGEVLEKIKKDPVKGEYVIVVGSG